VKEIVTTDTVYMPPERRHPKLRVLSAAPIFADAIRRNYCRQSIGHLVACGEADGV
jgi:ribose-phosphate pyrophosphokinase